MIPAPRVAARILAADLSCVGHEVAAAVRSGADRVHVDVMELGAAGVNVAPAVCRALRRVTRAPLEVHLLVRPAEPLVARFAAAGADAIAFHPEASDDVRASMALVRAHGREVGLAVSAGSPLEPLRALLPHLDLVLVTGAALHGERVAPEALRWITALRRRLPAAGGPVVSVDGGVDLGNAHALVEAGADALVVESALCRAGDRAAEIAALKGLPAWRAACAAPPRPLPSRGAP